MKSLWTSLHYALLEWNAHDAPRLGAALAFYTILSMAPLIILAMGGAAMVFDHSVVENHILAQFQETIGTDGAIAVRTMIDHAANPASGLFASVLGIATLLFGASGVFVELRSALNNISEVKSQGGAAGILTFLREKIFALAMVFAIGFLLLVSLLFSAALAAFGSFWGEMLSVPKTFLTASNIIISFAGVTILFALIFKYVPETTISWRAVWPGALLTTLLFTIGKFLIAVYLSKAAVGSAYGAAGSLIVVLVWVYYSSMIFFFGAEFTHILAQARQTTNDRA